MSDSDKNNSDHQYPSAASSYYVLSVLLLAYILSFIDRNIMSVLVGPVRAHFDISDFQFSLLHGMAFTLFYVVLGLPIGWLADRYSRKWIITGGVFFWSVMTCLCGLAKSFGGFFATRIGVGVGEATLSPGVYSILGDYFAPHKLRWATAVFAMGITLGSGLSYKIGSWLYQWFSKQDFTGIPMLDTLSAWQLTFVAVGLPGFIVVLLLLAVREPKRIPSSQAAAHTQEPPVPVRQVTQHLKNYWQAYGSLFFGIAMMAIIGYGTLGWYVEFLIRSYGMARVDAGNAMGNIFIIAGTGGTFAGAAFASWLQKRGYIDANLRVTCIAACALIIPAVAAPLMPDAQSSIALTWLVVFIHYTHFGVAMAALQLITPNRMRAQISALLLFTTNLFGLGLGVTVIAFFTDFVFADDGALRYSLATTAAIVYPLAALVVGRGLKYYRRALSLK